MEVRELLDYKFNHSEQILEISFRTIDDEESFLRNDKILFSDIDSFGFDLDKDLDHIEEEDDDIDFFGFDETHDEDEMISFLNEYYMIYPDRIPEKKDY